jgi:hypothetical protein
MTLHELASLIAGAELDVDAGKLTTLSLQAADMADAARSGKNGDEDIARALGKFAMFRALSITRARAGMMQAANEAEATADRIYRNLPPLYRW